MYCVHTKRTGTFFHGQSLMLRGLPTPYLRDLAMRARTEYYNHGDIIYTKETPIDRMIYIVRGNIDVSKHLQ